MAVQGVSGVAKDLAKMSSKSAVKLLAPADGSVRPPSSEDRRATTRAPSTEDGALFRWVAVLTGSKNAVKGLGFLVGNLRFLFWRW